MPAPGAPTDSRGRVPARNRLVPHARAYTKAGLERLTAGLPCRWVDWTVVFPGYDNIVARNERAGHLIQGLTSRVFEDEDRPPFVTSERQRLGCPCGIEFGCERVFVLEAPDSLGRWVYGG